MKSSNSKSHSNEDKKSHKSSSKSKLNTHKIVNKSPRDNGEKDKVGFHSSIVLILMFNFTISLLFSSIQPYHQLPRHLAAEDEVLKVVEVVLAV